MGWDANMANRWPLGAGTAAPGPRGPAVKGWHGAGGLGGLAGRAAARVGAATAAATTAAITATTATTGGSIGRRDRTRPMCRTGIGIWSWGRNRSWSGARIGRGSGGGKGGPIGLGAPTGPIVAHTQPTGRAHPAVTLTLTSVVALPTTFTEPIIDLACAISARFEWTGNVVVLTVHGHA